VAWWSLERSDLHRQGRPIPGLGPLLRLQEHPKPLVRADLSARSRENPGPALGGEHRAHHWRDGLGFQRLFGRELRRHADDLTKPGTYPVTITDPSTPVTATAPFVVEFLDVPVGYAYYDPINRLAYRGIAGGYVGGSYGPSDPVLRKHMAVFLLKAEHGSGYRPPDCDPDHPRFTDVACPSTYVNWIEQLAREGHRLRVRERYLRPRRPSDPRPHGGLHQQDVGPGQPGHRFHAAPLSL
jgi:hypothetical protein